MPHNNRMSIDASLKTSSIWSKTIGHNPHAGPDESGAAEREAQGLEQSNKTRDAVLAVARQQNLTDSASRDDFALKMYQGLKQTKKRSTTDKDTNEQAKGSTALHDDPLSSSEDEYVAVTLDKKRTSKKHKSRKHKKRHASSSDESDFSEEDRRRSKKRRRKKRSRKYSDDDDSDDSSDDQRRRSRSKDKRKRKKKHTRSSSSGSSSSDSRSGRSDRRHRNRDDKLSSQSKSELPFVAAESFAGSRRGYAFKTGDLGAGYYLDRPPKINKKELAEILNWHRDT